MAGMTEAGLANEGQKSGGQTAGDQAGTERAKIEALRATIDGLDEQIVRLISERAAAAAEIGRLKGTADLPVYEPQREKHVFEHVKRVNAGPLSEAEMLDIYERLIDVMRTLQRRDHK